MCGLLCLLAADKAGAQFNKRYFNYIGSTYMDDSQYEQAIKVFNMLLSVDPDAYETYLLRGIAKYNLDDLLGAELDLSTAIEKNPVYTDAYRIRGITRMRLGNYDDALKDMQEAIDLRPDRAWTYFNRGGAFLLSQQYDKAIADYTEFIKRETLVADAYLGRGQAYLNQKDTVRAYEDYNRAIRTNREDPQGYLFRGGLYMTQKNYDEALADFNKSIECDSAYIPAYFNRAVVYANSNRPMQAIADFDTVLKLDPTNSQTYFNRAILRTQIGDYNRALEDYDKVALYSPGNVLVYYNRADLHARLGNLEAAVRDYSKAIELYPDFANAYLFRSNIRYLLRDTKGAKTDQNIAERKISEYRSKLSDSTFSIYADTSRKFNQLLAFDTRMSGGRFGRVEQDEEIALKPMFRFVLDRAETHALPRSLGYYNSRVEDFIASAEAPNLKLICGTPDLPADSLLVYDRALAESAAADGEGVRELFLRAMIQAQIKQYTGSVNTYSAAIDKDPSNPFLYLNRAATRSEMIDFISSIDNPYQRITVDSDPSGALKNNSTRTYSYDEAISDLNKAAKLMPDFAYIYYNRANLQALSGRLPEAYEDYTRAIELYPGFGEAYYNRGLVQIYLKDTRKGCLDMSKAGELGIYDAYAVLKRYAYNEE